MAGNKFNLIIMISLIFLTCAAIFSAALERLKGGFIKSIFTKFNPHFWSSEASPYYQKTFAGYAMDASFFTQCFKVYFICLSIVCYVPIVSPEIDLFIFFGAWVFVYDTFYSLIFKRNKR